MRILLVCLTCVALILAACAPASATETPPLTGAVPTLVVIPSETKQLSPTATTPPEVTQPVPVATSRGDALEASDPATVQYGAGRPVLVEFFRFT